MANEFEMMTAPVRELDILGSLAIQWNGTGNYTYIPALRGSVFDESPNLQRLLMAANSSFEARNWRTGLTVPTFVVKTCAFASWFTPANLVAMLGPVASGGRSATTGLLPSLGKCEFRYGSGSAGDVSGQYDHIKLHSMQLSTTGIGEVVDVTCVFMAYGARSAAGTGTPVFTSQASGQPFLSQGISFNSTLAGTDGIDDVQALSLNFSNSLRPLTTLPVVTSVGSKVYPSDLINGPLAFTYSVTQTTGAQTVLESTNMNDTFLAHVCFTDPTIAYGTVTNSVLFSMTVFNPDRQETTNMDLATISRNYQNIMDVSKQATSLIIATSA